MQRSRMMAELRNLVRATRLARANRMTLNEVLQHAAERRHRPTEPSRRRFVKDVGAIAGAGLLLNNLPAHAFGNRAPRIAIVGGGISGLNAALTLQDAGLASTIYEASSEVGGASTPTRQPGLMTRPANGAASSLTPVTLVCRC